jgi:hypothetical protein
VEDGVDIVGVPLQGGGAGYVGDIDTIAEDSAENTVASAAPFVERSMGSLVVALCSVASADKAYRAVDDHQAWASARKACSRSDSCSFWGREGSVAAAALVFEQHDSQGTAIDKCSGCDPQVPGGRFMIGIG